LAIAHSNLEFIKLLIKDRRVFSDSIQKCSDACGKDIFCFIILMCTFKRNDLDITKFITDYCHLPYKSYKLCNDYNDNKEIIIDNTLINEEDIKSCDGVFSYFNK